MSIQYHEVFCENSKLTYGEFDICDFYLVGEGRDLVANSVRVEGSLRVNQTGQTRASRTNADDLYFNNRIGIHGIVESATVEMENMGVVQRANEYARMVGMRNMATKDQNDMANTNDQVELRFPDKRFTNAKCYGNQNLNQEASIEDVDFSFKPEVCLNQMSGGNLPFDKTGYIKLTLNLARDVAFLFGLDNATSCNYSISNLRVVYQSVPHSNSGKVAMRTYVMIKNSIQSSFSNTSAKVPAVCDAVSCSFIEQANENTLTADNYSCEHFPNIDHIQFLFNDTSTYIRYKIEDRGDILEKYLESMDSGTNNQVSTDKWKANNSFGIGVSFQGFVDLSKQKFNIQINSTDASINQRPIIMFSYFHSILEV
jgi:hypothetical protein